MDLYYVHTIIRYRKSEDEPFGEKEDNITYFDSLPHAVQEMKELSETTKVCKVDLACVGEVCICNHQLSCNIPLFFCENYDVIANTSEQSIFDYIKKK